MEKLTILLSLILLLALASCQSNKANLDVTKHTLFTSNCQLGRSGEFNNSKWEFFNDGKLKVTSNGISEDWQWSPYDSVNWLIIDAGKSSQFAFTDGKTRFWLWTAGWQSAASDALIYPYTNHWPRYDKSAPAKEVTFYPCDFKNN